MKTAAPTTRERRAPRPPFHLRARGETDPEAHLRDMLPEYGVGHAGTLLIRNVKGESS